MAEGRNNINVALASTSTSAATLAMNRELRHNGAATANQEATKLKAAPEMTHALRLRPTGLKFAVPSEYTCSGVGARDLWPKGVPLCTRRAAGSYVCEQSCVMPRLLLVAYHFPPEPTAAAVRLGQVAANLPKFGWQVSVLARPRDATTQADGVVQTPRAPQAWLRARKWYHAVGGAAPLKRVVRPILNVCSFPDQSIWWVPVAINTALRAAVRYDAVMTSYFPSAGHFIGSRLSRSLGIPWLADYQDLWSGNGMLYSRKVRSRLGRWVERRAIRGVSAVTCCKESFAQILHKLHGPNAPPVETIPFACDTEAWRAIPNNSPKEFAICYAGSLYPGHSSPDLLFGVIRRMRSQGSSAGQATRFHYYGQSGNQIMESARRLGVSDIVRMHGCVDRRAVMCGEREAAVLVSMFEVEGAFRRPWLPSKLFEYAGARRYVLGIGPAHSAVQEFIARNGLGLYASDEASCVEAIERLYRLYCEGRYEPNSDAEARLWSPADVAERFATILNRLIGANHAGFRGASLDPAEPALHV